jgi:CheY-like chemotaxis protein
VSVICADDNSAFLAAVAALVGATPGFTLVGTASSGESAITAVAALAPDLLLMDVRMRGTDGIAAARILLEHHPDLFVVLMSAHELPPQTRIPSAGPPVVFVRKEQLCGRVLLDLWSDRRTRHGPNGELVHLDE